MAPKFTPIELGPAFVFNCVGDITSATVDSMLVFDSSVRRSLAANPASQASVLIRLYSSGGETDAGAALYQIFRGFDVPVITAAYGSISSAGVIAFCGGKQRIVVEGTRVALHAPQWAPQGSYSIDEIRRVLVIGEHRLATTLRILMETMSASESLVNRELKAGTVFTASQAVGAGIATALGSAIAFTPIER